MRKNIFLLLSLAAAGGGDLPFHCATTKTDVGKESSARAASDLASVANLTRGRTMGFTTADPEQRKRNRPEKLRPAGTTAAYRQLRKIRGACEEICHTFPR